MSHFHNVMSIFDFYLDTACPITIEKYSHYYYYLYYRSKMNKINKLNSTKNTADQF